MVLTLVRPVGAGAATKDVSREFRAERLTEIIS